MPFNRSSFTLKAFINLGQDSATNNETWQTEKFWWNSMPKLHLYMFVGSPMKSFTGKNHINSLFFHLTCLFVFFFLFCFWCILSIRVRSKVMIKVIFSFKNSRLPSAKETVPVWKIFLHQYGCFLLLNLVSKREKVITSTELKTYFLDQWMRGS